MAPSVRIHTESKTNIGAVVGGDYTFGLLLIDLQSFLRRRIKPLNDLLSEAVRGVLYLTGFSTLRSIYSFRLAKL